MNYKKILNQKMAFLFLFILSFAFPFKASGAPGEFNPGSEPEGFRGIKWGTDIATLDDMEKIKTIFDEYSGLNITKYKKKNDVLKLSGSSL